MAIGPKQRNGTGLHTRERQETEEPRRAAAASSKAGSHNRQGNKAMVVLVLHKEDALPAGDGHRRTPRRQSEHRVRLAPPPLGGG
jgi:hypothetical protein